MRFVVTFNDTGTEGVMVFSAIDIEDALRFTKDTKHFTRPDRVSYPVEYSGNIGDLYTLFPRRKTVEES